VAVDEPSAGWGGFTYRLNSIEGRLKRIEDLEPAVTRQQLNDVKEDLHDLRGELGAIRKILTGFLVTFAFTGITIVISVVLLTQGA